MNDNVKLGIGLIASVVIVLAVLYALLGSSTGFIMHAIMFAVFVPIMVLGVYMTMTGKGSYLIAGFNTSPPSVKAAYDETALTKATGAVVVVLSVLMLIGIESFILDWNIWISSALIIAAVVFIAVSLVYLNGKRFKKDPDAPLPVPTDAERKRSRNVLIAVLGITAAIIAVVLVVMFSYGDVSADIEDDRITIKAPMVDETVMFDDIITIEFREDMERGSRVGGWGSSKISSGNFRNSEFGNYTLASYTHVTSYIVIETSKGHVAFNLSTLSETQDCLDLLRSKYYT